MNIDFNENNEVNICQIKDNNSLSNNDSSEKTDKLSKTLNNAEENKLTKLEIWYNSILKVITIIVIVLITILFFILVKNFVFGVGSFFDELNNLPAKLEIILGLPFEIAFKSYMIVPFILADLLIYLGLIIAAFKFRKRKTRIIKGKEIFYLIGLACAIYVVFLSIIAFNIESYNIKSVLNIVEIIMGTLLSVIYLEIIMLIIIILKRRRKN